MCFLENAPDTEKKLINIVEFLTIFKQFAPSESSKDLAGIYWEC